MPMEDFRLGFHQLTQMVQDWDIPSRITEKIQRWGIRYSQTKIQSIPISFLFYSFLFYILKKHPQLVKNYSQDILMSVSLALKKTYTIPCHHYFKETHNFDFAFVCLAKALQYFLVVNFPGTCFPKDLEASVYSTIVESILGYSVNQNTYVMVERRLLKRRHKNMRDSIDIQVVQSYFLSEKAARSDKKIHRNAQFNLFGGKDSEKKELDAFRMEIHEALYIKRSLPSKRDSNRVKITPNQPQHSQKTKSEWQKNIYSVMNLHQVSSAMAMQPGFNVFRGSSGLHLSKKRDLRQTYIPSEYRCEKDLLSTPSELISSVARPKSWSKIIEKMKEVNKENKKMIVLEPGSPAILSPPNLALKLRPTDIKKKNAKGLAQLKPLQFRSLNPSRNVSVEAFPCGEEVVSTASKKVSFAHELNKFEKRCKERRLNIAGDFNRQTLQS